jgi:3-oxoacyl-[acyl-carrier-protein] synthase-1
LGAAGVNESIYSLLMLQNDFMAESININTLDEAAEDMPIVQTTTKQTLNRVMSNSFGFVFVRTFYQLDIQIL